jgi:sec-independent protein translocase protein TatA
MELIIVLGIVVVIFGAGRIADLGGALGKGIREFREQTKTEEEKQAAAAATTPAATAVADPPAAPLTPAATTTVAGACPSCGRENPASQPFCGSCGARLATPAGTTSA